MFFAYKQRSFFLGAAFLVGSFFVFNDAQAATLYVSPTGSDTNSGTSAAPFKTIQKAADIVNPGDTVIVKDGVYTDTDGNERIVNLTKGGSETGGWVTFKSEKKWGAVLDGQNSVDYGIMVNNKVDFIRLEGFEIRNTMDGVYVDADSQTAPVYYADHVYMYQLKVHDIGRIQKISGIGQSGIGTDWPTHDITIDSSVFYNIGRLNPNTTPSAPESSCTDTSVVPAMNNCYNHDHAMYLRGYNNLVMNNIFYQDMKSGWFIQFGNYGKQNNTKIINNTFYGNNPKRTAIMTLWGQGGDGLYIENNIVHSSNSHCFDTGINWTHVYIRNNICYNTPNLAGDVTADGSSCSSLTYTCTGNITGQDPKFVDLANRNFHLQSTSPAIGKGLTTNAPTLDFDGVPRGSAIDIGAFEYVSGTPPPPPVDNPPANPTGLTVQ